MQVFSRAACQLRMDLAKTLDYELPLWRSRGIALLWKSAGYRRISLIKRSWWAFALVFEWWLYWGVIGVIGIELQALLQYWSGELGGP